MINYITTEALEKLLEAHHILARHIDWINMWVREHGRDESKVGLDLKKSEALLREALYDD